MDQARTAFELLLDIDERCRQHAAEPRPDGEPGVSADSFSGIGFRLGRHWYVSPMGEITEVLHELRASPIPGVKPWVRGVANLRGRLLPIMDLCGYVGQDIGNERRQRRILVLERHEVFAGLLVDEVAGLQHFDAQALQRDTGAELPAAVRPFVTGQFPGNPVWHVFSPWRLAEAADFLDVTP